MSPKSRQRRFQLIQDMGCIACLLKGVGWQLPDIHHLVDKGTRALSGGDTATIGLCLYHHRGQVPQGMTLEQAYHYMGPSLKLHKVEFEREFGQRKLLVHVNAQIANREAALISRAS